MNESSAIYLYFIMNKIKTTLKRSRKSKDRQYNDEKKKDRQYNDEKKKDRQYNGQKKQDIKTNNDLQNTTHTIKDRATRISLKTGSELRLCFSLDLT